jgi:hypothetical protein
MPASRPLPTLPRRQAAPIEWPGGVKMQLYWHFTPPSYGPLVSIPENRVYISRDRIDRFVTAFVDFSHGRVTADNSRADAGEIARPGQTFRRVRIESKFGKMLVMSTDGHYPIRSDTTSAATRCGTWTKPCQGKCPWRQSPAAAMTRMRLERIDQINGLQRVHFFQPGRRTGVVLQVITQAQGQFGGHFHGQCQRIRHQGVDRP